MSGPRRVQLRRSKGWRKPPGTIVVARPSKFGNPFRVGDAAPDGTRIADRGQAVTLFRDWLTSGPGVHTERHRVIHANLRELRGADLGCWCPEDGPCHADVLIELANPR